MQKNFIKRLVLNIVIVLIFSFKVYAEGSSTLIKEHQGVIKQSKKITIGMKDVTAEGDVTRTAKNILLIVDSSASQNDDYQVQNEPTELIKSFSSKFLLEKYIISTINQQLPENEGLVSGLRRFGYGACLNWHQTELLQAMQLHAQTDLSVATQMLGCASGGTPAEQALYGASHDLNINSDNKAIIFISDGNFTTNRAVKAVRQLKKEYGEHLCVYPIWNGNPDELEGYQNLQQLTAAACCGFTIKADALLQEGRVSTYLKQILYDFHTPTDTDCDGVIDAKDICPHTPLSAKTDKLGCWSIDPIYFATDKSKIRLRHIPILRELAEILRENPKLVLLVKGNTDDVATYQYNIILSDKRAKSVRRYLVNHGVGRQQVTTEADSFSNPIRSNDTAEGRQANRRAEFYILSQ